MISDPTTTIDHLYSTGAWFCLGIVLAFFALRWASQHIAWLEQDHHAVYVSALLGGLALLVVPAAQGTTPNLSMLLTALVTVIALASNPKKPVTPDAARAPQAGIVRLRMMLALALIGSPFLMLAPSCKTAGPVIGTVSIDCTVQNAGDIASVLDALKSALTGGGWSAVYTRAKQAGAAIGGCALATLVQDYLGGKAAPSKGDGQTARATLERFRADEAGGATFKTAAGAL